MILIQKKVRKPDQLTKPPASNNQPFNYAVMASKRFSLLQ
jgi:hypothetical protein